MIKKALLWLSLGLVAVGSVAVSVVAESAPRPSSLPLASTQDFAALERVFTAPPDDARPWVYWYFQDGHLTREGMKADLEAMKTAGIGGALYLEVKAMGVPKGPVGFMGPLWQDLIVAAIRDCERLGLEFSLGTGPGWCGAGGPWISADNAMQHLVGTSTDVVGGKHLEVALTKPAPRKPFFGLGTLPPSMRLEWENYYRDVAVIAFPTVASAYRLRDLDEKALYFRAPYSSGTVKAYLPPDATVLPPNECIDSSRVVELTDKLAADGTLSWDAPAGNWTIMRFGRTLTGQTTRPAPQPGLGWESGKFEKASADSHYEHYLAPLFEKLGGKRGTGSAWTTLHFDSWEMGSQNWSGTFREEFKKRRGYDSLRYLPAVQGGIVGSVEMTERFLWDLRRTAQELVIENHASRLRELAADHGLKFTIEPYDLNPAGDLALGDVADTPACEFWSQGYDTNYSAFEATSCAHTQGRKVVQAESFTANKDAWRSYPGSLKNQGDWALCAGINRFAFHRYSAQPELDKFPGLPWGPYGVHWERTQTWWDMVPAYHQYLTRCQALLQSGLPVADILYLDLEGAPNVFRPPPSALLSGFPDRKGYNFDGCSPEALIKRASVKNGRIVFPDGMSYGLLVLPRSETMTPLLLRKIKSLVGGGALVFGNLPKHSPSLENFPKADEEIALLAKELAASQRLIPDEIVPPLLAPPPVSAPADSKANAPKTRLPVPYPDYQITAKVLASHGLPPDFDSNGDLRYIHRVVGDLDLYMVGNRKAEVQSAAVRFRISGAAPFLWDAVTGERRPLPEYSEKDGVTIIPMEFAPAQSFFVVFQPQRGKAPVAGQRNFPKLEPMLALDGDWTVTFDEKRGGPATPVVFSSLQDWSKREENEIRFYSGTASYRKTFDVAAVPEKALKLDVGKVAVIAEVTLNGQNLGVAWCPPWQVAIPAGLLRAKGNQLEIKVANLWSNRLIGDLKLPAEKRIAQLCGSSIRFYKPNDLLLPSGLLGPVRVMTEW